MNESSKHMHYVIGLTAAKQLLTHTGEDVYTANGVMTGKSLFVCNAVSNAHELGLITKQTRDATKKMLSERVGKHTIKMWLIEQSNTEKEANIYRTAPLKEMQAYRHAWVDSMIAEFSSN